MTTTSGDAEAICAKQVIDTVVKDVDGNRIGKIEDIILDKQSNKIMFAVMSFGGFLGAGEKYHPIPWDLLDYDEDFNGYAVGLTKEDLKAAPSDSIDDLAKDVEHAYRHRVYD